jgi:hypothetical protein
MERGPPAASESGALILPLAHVLLGQQNLVTVIED